MAGQVGTYQEHLAMMMLTRILVATDFSPGSSAAVDRAVHLAAVHGASLHLLHAFDVSAWHSLKGIFDTERLSIDPPPDVRMQRRLAGWAASLAEQTGFKVEAHFGAGPPQRVIEAYVRAHAITLVVVGSRADPAVAGLGSTASKLVRSPACPILIVRGAESRSYEKVLSAIDLRKGSDRALDFALSLFPSAQHYLLYAFEQTLDPLRVSGFDNELIEKILGSMHAKAAAELEQLARSLSARTVHPVVADVADDVPARAILVCAADLPADCVVVGHHGPGAGNEGFLGNIAQHVIQYTTRDVLVVP
jgi:nucleotide-binding universal stress UspA family protein